MGFQGECESVPGIVRKRKILSHGYARLSRVLAPVGIPQSVQIFYAVRDKKVIQASMIISTQFAVVLSGIASFAGRVTRLLLTPEATLGSFAVWRPVFLCPLIWGLLSLWTNTTGAMTASHLAVAVCLALYLLGMVSPETSTIGMHVSLAAVPKFMFGSKKSD